MNVPMGLAWNLVGFQSSDGETAFSRMPNHRVTLKTGTRRGSTIGILLRLMRTLCPAFVPCASSPLILYQISCQLLDAKLAPTMSKVMALLGNGLNGIDVVRIWLAWRVIPLRRRPGLMCDYTCQKNDPL